jgi:hypothetical protein
MNIFGLKFPKLDPITVLTIIAFSIAGGIIGWLYSGVMFNA